MLKRWLRRWLGVEEQDRRAQNLDRALLRLEVRVAQHGNMSTRITGAENSCRLLEARADRLEAIRANWVPSQGSGPFLTLGEIADAEFRDSDSRNLKRLQESAARARGQTLEQYLADLERRHLEKAERLKKECENDPQMVALAGVHQNGEHT